ncbi:MAG TPA: metal-sulfur cluster assembly factor, partial [Candidatus Melainabacteria bacterium]|nr:metal-sulfur cluster assembly factor [Candidatus Melainabacteria bacterium]
MMTSLQEDVVRENLRTVKDPELEVNIIDLGLVYGIEIDQSNVTVKMTLTSPACPLGGVIQAQAHQAVKKLPWVKDVKVELVWSPRWDPKTMASEDAQMELGIL